MTGEVAALVLRDNYLQGQAVSLVEAEGAHALPALGRLMRSLEQAGRLDRAVEFLPDEAEVTAHTKAGRGLTRPEISVLLAYAKTSLYDDLLPSGLPEDEAFGSDLANYFPRALHERFGTAIKRHRLGREIVATAIANSVVNRAGPGFIDDIAEETEAAPEAIARAYLIAREVFELRRYWRETEAIDNRVRSTRQSEILRTGNELLRAAVLWFLRQKGEAIEIAKTIAAYAPGIARLRDGLRDFLGDEAPDLGEASARLMKEGVPEWLANAAAGAPYLAAAPAIVDAAKALDGEVGRVGRIFFSLGHALGLDWLRQSARTAEFGDYWQCLAAATAAEDLTVLQRDLTVTVLRKADGDWEKAISDWRARHGSGLTRLERLVEDCRHSGGVDAARLAIANRHLQAML
jgi:glutamate dehydrogenase